MVLTVGAEKQLAKLASTRDQSRRGKSTCRDRPTVNTVFMMKDLDFSLPVPDGRKATNKQK